MELALEQTSGQRQKAATILGIGRNTLTRKLKRQESPEDSLPKS